MIPSSKFVSPSSGIFLVILLTLLKEGGSVTEVNVGYPSMTMDYKIHVDAGKEDCVYQYAQPGSVFYVDFHVIRGGDGKASFMVKDPNGETVLPYLWETKATYEVERAIGGVYAICIDNGYSKLSARVVSVYIATYEAAGWDKFEADLKEIDVNTETFIKTFGAIGARISEVLQYLHYSKSQEARDYALVSSNYSRVGFWSTVQFVIILASGIFQVYTIRQFFREAPSHGKFKVRL